MKEIFMLQEKSGAKWKNRALTFAFGAAAAVMGVTAAAVSLAICMAPVIGGAGVYSVTDNVFMSVTVGLGGLAGCVWGVSALWEKYASDSFSALKNWFKKYSVDGLSCPDENRRSWENYKERFKHENALAAGILTSAVLMVGGAAAGFHEGKAEKHPCAGAEIVLGDDATATVKVPDGCRLVMK